MKGGRAVTEEESMTVEDWMLTLLVPGIPVVYLIF
tara:strand:- start:1133 stop:1237 length:105 start_codon:yes stop_codon:yes gene_type:complete